MSVSLRFGHTALWAVIFMCLAVAMPCGAVVVEGVRPDYPTTGPVINDNGDGPPSISIPLYTTAPGASGNSVEGTSVTPEPSSLLLVSIAAGALGLQRRSRTQRVG
jgi:hypothetical protein